MSSAATERFTRRFGVREAVVNAPMAGISGGALAAAVDAAGGLGVIGAGYGDRRFVAEQWARAGTDRVGVGLILWVLDDPIPEVAFLVELGVRRFFLSFGDPTPVVPLIHEAGGAVLQQVNTLEEARRAEAAGVDAVAVQGDEAGGHGRPGRALDALLPTVVDALGLTPVLASGGIADADDVARVRTLGAAGVVVGTRFYATEEALDTPEAKQRLVRAGAADTIRTRVFDRLRGPDWPGDYDGRAVANEATRHWHGHDLELDATIDAARARYAGANETGDLGWRVVWAGTGVEHITRIDRAQDVVEELALPLR